jgi:hypothetical protein
MDPYYQHPPQKNPLSGRMERPERLEGVGSEVTPPFREALLLEVV